MMRIRAMEERDLEAVRAIVAASPEAAQWSLTAYGLLLAEPARGRVLVAAEDDGAVVGFVCFRVAGQEAEVLNLAVLPALRRRGIGSQLLDQAVREASERGAMRLFLEVRKANAPAIRLYERHGFAAVGVRPAYYKDPPDDAAVLAVDLRPSRPVKSDAIV